jgi:hypothetical protein
MDSSQIPVELLTRPLRDWQLDITTLAILAMGLGRVYKAIRSGGGLRGIWRGLLYGENAPVPPVNPPSP